MNLLNYLILVHFYERIKGFFRNNNNNRAVGRTIGAAGNQLNVCSKWVDDITLLSTDCLIPVDIYL